MTGKVCHSLIYMQRFEKELNSWKKLGFLNPNNLTEPEASVLPQRYGTRIIVLNNDNKIILIKVEKGDYFTLIGGGIEDNEDIEKGMIRECKEESGYDVSVITTLGYIEIWKKEYKKFDFCYLVKTIGEPALLNLTKEEVEFGHELNYYSIDEAIKIVENEIENHGSFASIRTLIILKEAQKYLENVVK